jgi:hypothetical protein
LRWLKHIGVGFLVSFVGSLPLGYLNIVGLEVYQSGFGRLAKYLFGVITVEVVIIYLTLIFAEKLVERKKILRLIEAFSVAFMFILAIVFFANALQKSEIGNTAVDQGLMYPSYLLGVLLSCLNFLQLPFWTGWNLYLLNKKHILPGVGNELMYVSGTAAGTFCGMLVFVLVLAKLDSTLFSGYLMHVIAAAFFAIGIVQAWKFNRKYYGRKP